jgi:hypothetical protein
MRFGTVIAVLTAAIMAAPATAATIVQVRGVAGNVPFDGFSSSLGTLNSVTLSVAATTLRLGFVDTPAGSPPNTVAYSIDSYFRLISARAGSGAFPLENTSIQVSTRGSGSVVQNNGVFDMSASGTGTFDLSPSLFTDVAPFTLSISDPGRSLASESGVTFSSSVPATVFQILGDCRSGSSSVQCGFGSATLTYDFTSATVGAVPEPTTWAMMLIGFGVVGSAMRSDRRKSKVRVTYA